MRLTLLLLVIAGASPAAVAAQDAVAPATLEIRDFRQLWKVRFALDRPAHVVVLGWSDHAGAVRHYPRRGATARHFEAGEHWAAGDRVRLAGWHSPPQMPASVRYVSGTTHRSPVVVHTVLGAPGGTRTAAAPDVPVRERIVVSLGFYSVTSSGGYVPDPVPVWRVHLFAVDRPVSAREVEGVLEGIDPWLDEATYMDTVARLLGATARAPGVIAP